MHIGTSESRSYGGGMKIAPVRDNKTNTIESYMPVVGSSAERATVVAESEACVSSNTASTVHPPPPLQAAAQQCNSSIYKANEPFPSYYTAAPTATAVAQRVGYGAALVTEKDAAQVNLEPVSASYYHSIAPGRVVPSTSVAAVVLPETQQEFSYSASTEATEVPSYTMRETAASYDTAKIPAPAPVGTIHVCTVYASSRLPAPAANDSAASTTEQSSSYGHQAPSVNPSAPITATGTVPPSSVSIISKPSLAPEVLARIEANRAAALAKLAAAKQRAEQPLYQHNAPSSTSTVAAVPSIPSSSGAISSPAAFTNRTVSSPAQLQSVLLSRSCAVNVPPGYAQPPSTGVTGGHVFSTARGKSVEVSEEQLQKANALLASSDLPNATGTTATKSGVPAVAAAATKTVPYGSCPHATLYFDGGSLGNPGKGGAGYQLFALNGRTMRESAVRMNGICTNNQAEYVGLIHGMTAALHCGVQQLTVYGDSEVVIKQVLGQYQVKNPVLIGLHQRASALKQRFNSIQLQWIPREKNSGADALSKKAMHRSEEAQEAADWFVPT